MNWRSEHKAGRGRVAVANSDRPPGHARSERFPAPSGDGGRGVGEKRYAAFEAALAASYSDDRKENQALARSWHFDHVEITDLVLNPVTFLWENRSEWEATSAEEFGVAGKSAAPMSRGLDASKDFVLEPLLPLRRFQEGAFQL